MRPEDRALARRQLDKRLNTQHNVDMFTRPSRGWIKAIRESIGMTTAQLAERLGLSQPRIVAIEKAEKTGAITLDTLKRTAQALDCRLVYTLVPIEPLEVMVYERASRLAKKRMKSTRHSMSLEAQELDSGDEKAQRERMVQKLIEKAGSELWDGDV